MASDGISTGAAPRIAVVTTDESVQLAAQEVLAAAFHTTLLGSGEQVLPLLVEATVEAIILDLETAHESDEETLRLVRQLRQHDQHLVLLGFTRSHNKSSRNQFEQAGISRCFVAPVDFEEVHAVLHAALDERSAEIENRRIREDARSRNSFCQLIGGSEPMRLVYDAISRVAESNVNVLVRGESGTGKELVAQAIVASGPRRDKPFVSVNCAALPESLIEAELFGHEKGAFTDAHEVPRRSYRSGEWRDPVSGRDWNSGTGFAKQAAASAGAARRPAHRQQDNQEDRLQADCRHQRRPGAGGAGGPLPGGSVLSAQRGSHRAASAARTAGRRGHPAGSFSADVLRCQQPSAQTAWMPMRWRFSRSITGREMSESWKTWCSGW